MRKSCVECSVAACIQVLASPRSHIYVQDHAKGRQPPRLTAVAMHSASGQHTHEATYSADATRRKRARHETATTLLPTQHVTSPPRRTRFTLQPAILATERTNGPGPCWTHTVYSAEVERALHRAAAQPRQPDGGAAVEVTFLPLGLGSCPLLQTSRVLDKYLVPSPGCERALRGQCIRTKRMRVAVTASAGTRAATQCRSGEEQWAGLAHPTRKLLRVTL